MIVSASDIFRTDASELLRKTAALSLLTAVNLAFRGKGIKGCTVTQADIAEGESGQSILTICATDGAAPATLDDLRAALKRGIAQ